MKTYIFLGQKEISYHRGGGSVDTEADWSDVATRIRRIRRQILPRVTGGLQPCSHLGCRAGKLGFGLLTSKLYNIVHFYRLKPIYL